MKNEKLPDDLHIQWSDLSHRARSLISLDCEPNYIRAMLDRAVLTMGEDKIEGIEQSLRSGESEIAKNIIFDQLLDCIFDDVHIDEYIN